MQESKYEVINLKQWEITRKQLIKMKNEIFYNINSISFNTQKNNNNYLNHTSKYNKTIEEIEKYNELIRVYDIMINRLKNAINILLSTEEKEIINIYINYPEKNQSEEREYIALNKGYSRSSFYKIAKDAFNSLDTVLDIQNNKVLAKYKK